MRSPSVRGLTVATPARVGFDLARHLPRVAAIAHLDDLARATRITQQDLLGLIDRYPGARGNKRARLLIDLMDAGAESPKESWLRIVLIDAGFARPTTQIRVVDGRQSRISTWAGKLKWSLSNTTATTIAWIAGSTSRTSGGQNCSTVWLAGGQGDQRRPATRHRRTGRTRPGSTWQCRAAARQQPRSWCRVICGPGFCFARRSVARGQLAGVAQLRRVGDIAAFAFPRRVPAPTAAARPGGDKHVPGQEPVAPCAPVGPCVRVEDEVVVNINSHRSNSDSSSDEGIPAARS